MPSLPMLACLLVSLLLLASMPMSTEGACAAAATFLPNSTVNVAILVYLINQKNGLFTGDISDTKATNITGMGTSTIQPYQLAVDLYLKKMRARGNMLPLPNGNSVKVNFTLINLAGLDGTALAADYSKTLALNIPAFTAVATYPKLSPLIALPTFQRIVSSLPAAYRTYGLSAPFTYVVLPPVFLGTPDIVNLVENAQSKVIVHPFLTDPTAMICDDLAWNVSLTPDCTSPTYNRNRLGGARRFQTLFGTLFDATTNQQSPLEYFRMLGITSVAIFNDAGLPFSVEAAAAAADAADTLGISVLATYALVESTNCNSTAAVGGVVAANCPPQSQGGLYASQTQVFSNSRTALDIALELKALNVEALIILAQGRSTGAWTFAQLLESLKDVNYSPKEISWGGGVETFIPSFLDDATDLDYTWTTKPWDYRLKGSMYKNYGSKTQFELLPAITKDEAADGIALDGPAVFADAFDAAYGPSSNTGPGGVGTHAMYDPLWKGVPGMPAIGWSTMIIVQKMIEASMTLDVPTILSAAKSISTPSVFHQLQFDMYGRTSRVDTVALQILPAPATSADSLVLSPFNIGETPIYPLPTWPQRVFKPVFYAEANERIMIAITSLCIALCLVLVGVVVWHWRSAVIRAATPSFCLVIILGGILMLTSNYFNTLVVDSAHCAASTWLLTMGFTLVFASLFVKTFRIFKIFGQQRLQVLKLKDHELLIAVGVFLLFDVIINAAWMGSVGMNAVEVVVDVARPSLNYLTCDFGPANGAIFTHIALKAALLLFGVGLTWAVRNTPSQFNESSSIALAIYQVSFIVCFILPIIATGLGGRHTVYLIRAFAIIFCVMATLLLLFVPKIILLSGSNLIAQAHTKANVTLIGSPTSPKGVLSMASGASSNGSGGVPHPSNSHAQKGGAVHSGSAVHRSPGNSAGTYVSNGLELSPTLQNNRLLAPSSGGGVVPSSVVSEIDIAGNGLPAHDQAETSLRVNVAEPTGAISATSPKYAFGPNGPNPLSPTSPSNAYLVSEPQLVEEDATSP